ncbi:MAG: tetratricopeptide repeat protein [Leptolyngbya sp. SIO1E4]|nr:tetratricopeptide repeat protein [Leptolyngbya sp. SIO1E4]
MSEGGCTNQQLLTLIRESGDRPTELTVIIALADTYSSLGQYPQAIDLLEQALEIAQSPAASQCPESFGLDSFFTK